MMTSKSYADSPTRLPLTTLFVAVRVTAERSVHATPLRHIMLTFYAISLLSLKNYILLDDYAASSGNSLPAFGDNLPVPSSTVKNPNPWPLEMGPIGCHETSVRIATTLCFQKSAILVYFVAEAWNHANFLLLNRMQLSCTAWLDSLNTHDGGREEII